MNSRTRVLAALNHEVPDRVPIDLGATFVTGIAASAYAQLRVALRLELRPPRVIEPLQVLAEVDDDVLDVLGADAVGLWLPSTMFGFRNEDWKPWKLQDGTDVEVLGGFVTSVGEHGDVFLHPKGQLGAAPSGRMPKDGFYFDGIVRQRPLDETHLDPGEWAESFEVFTDEDLGYLRRMAEHLRGSSDRAIVANFGDGGLGDIARVPGLNLEQPKGVRDPALWYEFLASHPDYAGGTAGRSRPAPARCGRTPPSPVPLTRCRRGICRRPSGSRSRTS